MTKRKTKAKSKTAAERPVPPIDKRLFEAGSQCAKRLYLEYHRPDETPDLDPHRQELAEIGSQLVEMAAEAFPKGEDLAELGMDDAVQRTREFLEAGKPGVLFHAAFRGGGAEARVDILLVTMPGALDLFEVKAGTGVKPRHLLDVALQIHSAETSGHAVQSSTILHLDGRYVHNGGTEYPTQKMFKSVDVTERARKQLDRVRDGIKSFRPLLEDESTLELPTGTWCRNPLPCPHLDRCIAEGPEHPLVTLPQLAASQLTRFHEQAIESIDQLDPEQQGLAPLQRRAVRAHQTGDLVVEPFVSAELRDLDWPVAFLHIGWHLDVLPRFVATNPWQKLPFSWSAHLLDQKGNLGIESRVSATAEDPRETLLEPLAELLKDVGTLIVYPRAQDERLHALLQDGAPAKSAIRTLLQLPLFELGHLIYHGAYHPELAGDFGLWRVHDTVTAAAMPEDAAAVPGFTDPDEIDSDLDAQQAYKRILKSRTRDATRKKLAGQIDQWNRRCSAALVRIYRCLENPDIATPAPASADSAPADATAPDVVPDADSE